MTGAQRLAKAAQAGLTLAGFLILFAGCRSYRPIEPIDTREPGWRVYRGQAVWKPGRTRPELAGDLLVAVHTNRGDFVQFEKPPFPLVYCTTSVSNWTVAFPAAKRSFRGKAPASTRFIWPHLTGALEGRQPAKDLEFSGDARNGWRLENARTGEWLEGYLEP